MFNWQKKRQMQDTELQKLQDELEKARNRGNIEIVKNTRLETRIENMKERHEKEMKDKDAEIEVLKMEIDMYRMYYKLNEEPTEKEKLAIRINKQIFDLKLENIMLKKGV